MKYFALTMSVVYALAGCMILFTDFLPQVSKFRIPLGIILLVYGAVRGFMWQRKQAESREEQ